MSFESDFLSMINSILGPISHHLATIVLNSFQGHPRLLIYMSNALSCTI